MKKIIYLIFYLSVVFSCTESDSTLITIYTGNIPTANSSNCLITNDSIYTLSFDSTNTSFVTLPNSVDCNYATIQLNNINIPIYIERGKDFDLALQKKEHIISTIFTGQGSSKNSYLNNKIFIDNKLNDSTNIDSVIQIINKRENLSYEYLGKQNFDSRFVEKEKERIHYSLLVELIKFCNGSDQPIPNEIKTAITSTFSEKRENLELASYRNFLLEYINYTSTQNIQLTDESQKLRCQMNFITEQFTDSEIIEYCLFTISQNYIKYHGVIEDKNCVELLLQHIKNQGNTNRLKTLSQKWQLIAMGNPSIDFTYKDRFDKSYNLASFKGQNIYIFYWSSWCKPCTQELKYLGKLKDKYNQEGMKFVAISCDKDKTAWLESIKNKRSPELQLYWEHDFAFQDFYQIRTIPRIILLDTTGKIVNSQMPYPSNPKTTQIIDSLLGIK